MDIVEPGVGFRQKGESRGRAQIGLEAWEMINHDGKKVRSTEFSGMN